jgi:hypothetical protein
LPLPRRCTRTSPRSAPDLEEGLLEPLRVQAVEEEGEDGVARGLARAEVG